MYGTEELMMYNTFRMFREELERHYESGEPWTIDVSDLNLVDAVEWLLERRATESLEQG